MILKLWQTLAKFPFGKSLFHFALQIKVPYTGSISPKILELSQGHARVQMRDRRRVRNHLHSIHAIALMNLGEAASGLAVMSCLPTNTRGIVTRLEIDFIKKARGTLIATSNFSPPSFSNEIKRQTFQVEATIRNSAEETVAVVKANWLVDTQRS